MILASTTETVPFTPDWLKEKPSAPIFHLRAGSVIERGQMEAELAGPHRAAKVWGYELRGAIISGVQALLAGDPDFDHLMGLIASENEEDFNPSEEDKRLLAGTRAVLSEHWPEYRDLIAQMERRREIAPIIALRRFCTGWENCTSESDAPVPFARDRDGMVSDVALRGLKWLELINAGNRAFSLQYGAGEEKNSPPPPPSEGGLEPMSSDDASKAAGKSKAKGGRKTPA